MNDNVDSLVCEMVVHDEEEYVMYCACGEVMGRGQICSYCRAVRDRHHWKDGWMCERCGMRRADYEDMKRHNESGEGRPRAAEKDDGHGQQA